MKTICFYFTIHQPYRLKRYRFFNIGNDHYYYDDFSNEDIMQQIASRSYIPANRMMLDLVNTYKGKFKFAISVSGVALDQMEVYAPEVIDGLQELSRTGNVEFLAEPYAHSLSSVMDPAEFKNQITMNAQKIKLLFGQEPKAVKNTELIYSDEIAEMVYEMGYNKMISEGAKRILSWRSPNYVYQSENQPNMKLLLRNTQFSDDISLRFNNYTWNEYPLTAEKYINWIATTSPQEEVFNIFLNYEVFGNLQPSHSGIFEFMKALPKFAFEKRNRVFHSFGDYGHAQTRGDYCRILSHFVGRRRAGFGQVDGKQFAKKRFEHAASNQRASAPLPRPPYQTRLDLPANFRPFLLYVHKAFLFGIASCTVLTLSITLRCFQQLHERFERFHGTCKRSISRNRGQRGAQLAAYHHSQPGTRD